MASFFKHIVGIGSELISFFIKCPFFVTVGFFHSRRRSTVTDGGCRQIHFTRHFSHAVCTPHFMHITLHGSSVCMRASFHLHVIHEERLIVRSLSVSLCLSFSCFSLLFNSSLPYPTCTLTCTPSSMSTAPMETTAAPSPNEEYGPLAIYHPPTICACLDLPHAMKEDQDLSKQVYGRSPT